MVRIGPLNQFSPLLLQQLDNPGTLFTYLEPLAGQTLAILQGSVTSKQTFHPRVPISAGCAQRHLDIVLRAIFRYQRDRRSQFETRCQSHNVL